MDLQFAVKESFEISPRFRQTLEERIARLERDAAHDEAQLDRLNDIDHIRRQMRLVAVERAEALRMRIFLDRAKTRHSRADDRAVEKFFAINDSRVNPQSHAFPQERKIRLIVDSDHNGGACIADP